LLVVRDKREEPDQYQRELENIRRMKAQAQLTALSAPLGVKRASTNIRPGPEERDRERDPGNPLKDFDTYSLRESSYDPAADRDKEAFSTAPDVMKAGFCRIAASPDNPWN
jgi:type IV secretion system protein VirB10